MACTLLTDEQRRIFRGRLLDWREALDEETLGRLSEA